MIRTLILLACLGTLAPSWGQMVTVVEKTNVTIMVPLTGTVIPAEKTVIESKDAGRIEALPVPSKSPFQKREVLAIISSPEVAAIIDANATTPQEMVQERWQKMFKPHNVRAPFDGFLLESKVGLREWVKEGQPLFVATPQLFFEATVSLKDTTGMSPGKPAKLWKQSNPELKMAGKVRQILPGTPVPEKATIRIAILPEEDVALPLPGTLLEGQVMVAERKSAVTVPAGAIRRFEGRSFVTVEIQEGISDGVRTEIESGLRAGQVILVPRQ